MLNVVVIGCLMKMKRVLEWNASFHIGCLYWYPLVVPLRTGTLLSTSESRHKRHRVLYFSSESVEQERIRTADDLHGWGSVV